MLRIPKTNINHEVQKAKKQNNAIFYWDAPSNWIETDKGSIRLASYKIPYLESYADLSITKFPGNAGGIEANVNRWRSQLGLSKQTLNEIEPKSISGISGLGKYSIYRIQNNNMKNEII